MDHWRARWQNWAPPLALLVGVLLSYGLWIPWLGIYGNDVPYLWYYHLLGPWGPGEFAAMDRPVSGLFYAAVTLALGENIWLYHILLLALRWLSGLLLWKILRLVWPECNRAAAIAAILFVIYPGFRQNPVALEFILHLAVLDLFLLSMLAMLSAVSRPNKPVLWLLLSLVTAAGPFFLEYFVGLEILRPIFLWLLTRRQGLSGKKQWSKIFSAWLPALVVVQAFLAWRVLIFSFRTYQPVLLDQLRANPLDGLLHLGSRIVGDLWTAFAGAWQLVFQFPQNSRWLLQDFLLIVGCAGVIFVLFTQIKDPPSPTGEDRSTGHWGELLLGLGLVAMLAGGAVFWITGIEISVEFPWDRSTLSLMLGASLVGVGLLEMLAAPRYRLFLAAVLIGLAAGAHYQNAQV